MVIVFEQSDLSRVLLFGGKLYIYIIIQSNCLAKFYIAVCLFFENLYSNKHQSAKKNTKN